MIGWGLNRVTIFAHELRVLVGFCSVGFWQPISSNLVNALEDPGRSIKDDNLLTQSSRVVMVVLFGRLATGAGAGPALVFVVQAVKGNRVNGQKPGSL